MMAHKVELELQLASEINLHPEIPVNTSCQHIEELDEEKGPRLRVSPRLTAASASAHHFLKSVTSWRD